MEGQMTFEFAKRPTIKGYPELRWTGKRPYESTQYYPAQLRERYGEETNGWINKIFWGDNLQVMSHLLKEYRGKVQLIYIDPPFDSRVDYKMKVELKGKKATNDISTFEEKQYGDIWTNDEYLQFMYERIVIMKELLSDTGVLYIHCDWHKGHYIKCIMDELFGADNFINEITWYYYNKMAPKSSCFPRTTDKILVYSKTPNYVFNTQYERREKPIKQLVRKFVDGKAINAIVACYNYTGTPYVKKQVLPEVVYAYGLNESIAHGYLKDADPIGFENVKSEVFLRTSITKFWERYGGKTYEGLLPKLAIFAANVKEATDVVRPAVEKVLSELGISLSTVLVNTGDPSVTKDEDIKNFNNLDVIGTEGSKKQFIILVEKGREGWNCRSLLGIALFRSPKSKVFVLQATMRCLRQLTKEQLKATIFLSKENYDTLDDELRKNYNMEISDFGKSPNTNKKVYKVRVLPPPRSIKMKRLWHEYSLIEKEYSVR